MIDAIANFVAQCVVRMPECRNLSHEQMLKMLDGTFSELREKGPLGQMWHWFVLPLFFFESFFLGLQILRKIAIQRKKQKHENMKKQKQGVNFYIRHTVGQQQRMVFTQILPWHE